MNYISPLVTLYNLSRYVIDYDETYRYIKNKLDNEIQLLMPENENTTYEFSPTTNLELKSNKIIKKMENQIKEKNNNKRKQKLIIKYKECIDRQEDSGYELIDNGETLVI